METEPLSTQPVGAVGQLPWGVHPSRPPDPPSQQTTCGSSGDISLLCCFTQVLKINLTLIALTREKLIEVLFLIYEEP